MPSGQLRSRPREDGRKAIVEERARWPLHPSTISSTGFAARPSAPARSATSSMVGRFDCLRPTPVAILLWGWQEVWHGHGLSQGMRQSSRADYFTAPHPSCPEIDEFRRQQLAIHISDLSTVHHLHPLCRGTPREARCASEQRAWPQSVPPRRVRVCRPTSSTPAPQDRE